MSGLTLITAPLSQTIRSWFGTEGADTGIGSAAGTGVLGSQDLVYGYQGNDTLEAQFSPSVQIFGGQGDDSLTGSFVSFSVTRIFGNLGDDTIIGLGGATNLLSGNQGNDTIFGADNETTIDSLNGGQGNDVLRARGGSDYLSGDLGADVLWGDEGSTNQGNDTLSGGQESDTIVGGGANDLMYGGQGNDYIEVDNSLSSNSPSDAAYVAGNDTVYGDAGDDTIGRSGTTGNDWYDGGEGNDSILGGNQANSTTAGVNTPGDTLVGGAGNDSIHGGLSTTDSGADSISGGAGNDTIAGGGEADNAAFQTGRGDTISGGEGNDSILGQGGNDSITGDAGADTISGGSGGDSLNGGADNDSISGDAGNDSIIGGAGADTLTGGEGSDTLIGSSTTSDDDNAVDVFKFDITGFASGSGYASNGTAVNNQVTGLGTTNIPEPVSVANADYILNFKQGQDKIEITKKTVTGLTVSFGNDTPVPLTNQTIVFGKSFSAIPAAGQNATDTNFASYIGEVHSTSDVALGSPSATQTLVYVERDGLRGFAAGDIAVAVLNSAVTLNANDFTFV